METHFSRRMMLKKRNLPSPRVTLPHLSHKSVSQVPHRKTNLQMRLRLTLKSQSRKKPIRKLRSLSTYMSQSSLKLTRIRLKLFSAKRQKDEREETLISLIGTVAKLSQSRFVATKTIWIKNLRKFRNKNKRCRKIWEPKSLLYRRAKIVYIPGINQPQSPTSMRLTTIRTSL